MRLDLCDSDDERKELEAEFRGEDRARWQVVGVFWFLIALYVLVRLLLT